VSIAVVDHQPRWLDQARRLLGEVGAVLAPLPGSGHFDHAHIGSTAVPGLAAKPILTPVARSSPP
jgi:GrpB-like predicted nucleotidyltransferase (UPF0157 family)